MLNIICFHKIIHYFISIFQTQNEGVLDAGALVAGVAVVVAVELAEGVAAVVAAVVAVELAAGVAAEASPSSPSASASLFAFNSAFFSFFSFFFSLFSSFLASFAFSLSAFFYFLASLVNLLSASSVSPSTSPSFAALSASSVSPSSYVAFPYKINSSSTSFPHYLIAESMHTQKDPVTGSLFTFYKNELYKAKFFDCDLPSMNY